MAGSVPFTLAPAGLTGKVACNGHWVWNRHTETQLQREQLLAVRFWEVSEDSELRFLVYEMAMRSAPQCYC